MLSSRRKRRSGISEGVNKELGVILNEYGGIDQHPLMVHLLIWATQQMHGQQSLSIFEKYFRQSRSAGTSAPFSWAAFSQTGKALLISSMHLTSKSWGQSAAEARRARRAKAKRAMIFMLIKKLLINYFSAI